MECKVTARKSHYPKEVPFEVPEGWCWCKLEELCAFLSRGKSPVYSETSKEYPVFAQKCNLKEGGISLEKALFLNPDTLPKWPTEYRLKTGDVLVNSTGTGTVGRTRLFNEQVLGPYPFVVPDSHVSVIRTFNQISSEYVFILLSSEYGQQYFADNLAGSTNQKELYIASIAELQVPLPPAMEQLRIAKQVSSFEDNIKNLDEEKIRIQAFVESAKAKILELAIHGKLVPQNPSDEPAIELLKRINPDFRPSDNLHYKDIPQSWTVCRLSDVCVDFIVPQRDKPRIFDGNIPWCRIEDIEGKYLNGSLSGRLVSMKTIQQMNMRICPVGTVICSCSASIGTQAIVTRPCCTNQTFIGLVPNERLIYNEFLYYFLASQTEQLLEIGTGTTIKYISREKFEEYKIPLPPLAEQRRIVERIEYYLLLLMQINSANSAVEWLIT